MKDESKISKDEINKEKDFIINELFNEMVNEEKKEKEITNDITNSKDKKEFIYEDFTLDEDIQDNFLIISKKNDIVNLDNNELNKYDNINKILM